MSTYSHEFFDRLQDGARRSARTVVPMVIDLLQPQSVIDIGCGLGTWLSVFREHGVKDIFGVDGEYVDQAQLDIQPEHFLAHDLTRPLRLDRSFDLVVSLEVAEHLPAVSASTLIESLTNLGDAVLFSAAIPFQGGTGHVNEQWPEYWARLFNEREYTVIDCFRPRLWLNDAVDWWYQQNLLLFVKQTTVERHVSLLQECRKARLDRLSLVHPQRYLEWVEWGLSLCEPQGNV